MNKIHLNCKQILRRTQVVTRSVAQIMPNKPVKVTSDTIIRDVATLLAKKEFHVLPVVDNEEPVGTVTATDLLNFLIDRC